MDENVRTIIPAQKAISLRIVKPFYFTNHLTLLLKFVRDLARENTNCGKTAEALALTASRTDRLKSYQILEESDLNNSLADYAMSLPQSKLEVVFKQRQNQSEFVQFEGLVRQWSVLRLKHDQEETVQPAVRVLVVDEFEPWRRFASSTLRKRPGLKVVGEASDALDAYEKAVELEPDLILMGIGLSSLNGIDAARRIREMVPEAKIIFLSENSSAEVVQEAMSLGASAYVVKAMVAIELLTVVEAVLSGTKFVSI